MSAESWKFYLSPVSEACSPFCGKIWATSCSLSGSTGDTGDKPVCSDVSQLYPAPMPEADGQNRNLGGLANQCMSLSTNNSVDASNSLLPTDMFPPIQEDLLNQPLLYSGAYVYLRNGQPFQCPRDTSVSKAERSSSSNTLPACEGLSVRSFIRQDPADPTTSPGAGRQPDFSSTEPYGDDERAYIDYQQTRPPQPAMEGGDLGDSSTSPSHRLNHFDRNFSQWPDSQAVSLAEGGELGPSTDLINPSSTHWMNTSRTSTHWMNTSRTKPRETCGTCYDKHVKCGGGTPCLTCHRKKRKCVPYSLRTQRIPATTRPQSFQRERVTCGTCSARRTPCYGYEGFACATCKIDSCVCMPPNQPSPVSVPYAEKGNKAKQSSQ